MQQVRQILCIHLPQWSITRCCRRHPEYRNSALVIIQTAANRRQVVEASERAKKLGVRPGMSVAEARALCGKLNCVEQDVKGDHRSLSALGRWLMRFTPDVANGWDGADENAPTALFLDLTGCERLFGGIDPIVRQTNEAMAEFDIPAQMAVAQTPGAAWATAVSLVKEVAKLPVVTLRLDESVVANLHRLGLRQVGDLLVIPRPQLLARFGAGILLRLDQLTGDRLEPLTRLITSVPITAKMEFDAPIEAVEEILLVFEKLLDGVLKELASRGRGVRQMSLILKPDAGWGKPIIMRKIVLSRAHRHRSTLFSLVECEMERVDCENGFVRFQIDVPLHELLNESQTQLFEEQHEQEKMELDRLLQRLRGRLGEGAVIRPERVESYLPERAWQGGEAEPAELVTAAPRPLTLLPMPIEIRVVCEPSNDRTGRPHQFTDRGKVHRLTQVTGPERIAAEWWRGHRPARDYYEVEDDVGRRFWIFRVGLSSRWFVHGVYG